MHMGNIFHDGRNYLKCGAVRVANALPLWNTPSMSEQVSYGGVVPEFDKADRLRRALRHAGFEGAEMAKILGVTPRTVSNYLTGRHEPSRATVVAWALATGVDLTWLETGQAPTEPSGPAEDGGTPPGTRTLNPLIKSQLLCQLS